MTEEQRSHRPKDAKSAQRDLVKSLLGDAGGHVVRAFGDVREEDGARAWAEKFLEKIADAFHLPQFLRRMDATWEDELLRIENCV